MKGPGSWAHGIGLDELNWSSNSNTCGNRNEVQLWILKRMVMVLIFWARCYLNFGNTDLFLSYMLQRVGLGLGYFQFSIALPISSIACNLLIHVVKWALNQYPYSILACVHTVAIAAMLIFTDITSGFSALLMARRIIKFIQKRSKKGPIQIMQFILLYHSFTATMQQALQFTTRVGKNKLDS